MTRSKSTGNPTEKVRSVVADVLMGILDSGKEMVSAREFKDIIESVEKEHKEKGL